jgi:hypothetical protein
LGRVGESGWEYWGVGWCSVIVVGDDGLDVCVGSGLSGCNTRKNGLPRLRGVLLFSGVRGAEEDSKELKDGLGLRRPV